APSTPTCFPYTTLFRSLRSASVALTQTLSLDAVLQTLLDCLGQLVPYDTANVMLLQGDSQLVAAVRAGRGYERWGDLNLVKAVRSEEHTSELQSRGHLV